MNPIRHLKASGEGSRIFLVGNGPSLNQTDLDRLVGEDSIAMNRIDLLYWRVSWRPTYYLFSSSNCSDPRWGQAWSRSVVRASAEDGTTPLIWARYKDEIESRAGFLPKKTLWLQSMSEGLHTSGVYGPNDFSTNAEERLDKSGTTMNVALQLAYYMAYDEVYLIGCDSNWATATQTHLTGDPNHFDGQYHASIANGAEEFQRMNQTHEVARVHFERAGRRITNAGYNSAITAYEKVDYLSLFA